MNKIQVGAHSIASVLCLEAGGLVSDHTRFAQTIDLSPIQTSQPSPRPRHPALPKHTITNQ